MLPWQSILTALAALAAVLLLIWLARGGVRLGGSWTAARAGRTLALEESLALDPRRRLSLVRCGNKRVLLLTGGAQDVLVGWLGEADRP